MRRFRLRNSMIVEEIEGSLIYNGWNEEYTIVEGGTGDYQNGHPIALVCYGGDYPIGDFHGSEFDIVEEII